MFQINYRALKGDEKPGGVISFMVKKVGITLAQIRHIALSLPNAVEMRHHDIPSFRVNNRIFETIWDKDHLNVMLDPVQIFDTAEKYPRVCSVFWWGRRPRCVQVNLQLATLSLVKELLKEAWQRKAS